MAYCPNCEHQLSASAIECPRCGALFTGGATWAPEESQQLHLADGGTYLALSVIHAFNVFLILLMFGGLFVVGTLIVVPIMLIALTLISHSFRMARDNKLVAAGCLSFGIVPILFGLLVVLGELATWFG